MRRQIFRALLLGAIICASAYATQVRASGKCAVDKQALARAIASAARRHGVQSRRLTALAYLESSFGVQACQRLNSNGTTDSGPFQINSVHLGAGGLCEGLQVETLQGNADCAARLVLMHRRVRERDAQWLARYHSKTPRHKRRYWLKLQEVKRAIADAGE